MTQNNQTQEWNRKCNLIASRHLITSKGTLKFGYNGKANFIVDVNQYRKYDEEWKWIWTWLHSLRLLRTGVNYFKKLCRLTYIKLPLIESREGHLAVPRRVSPSGAARSGLLAQPAQKHNQTKLFLQFTMSVRRSETLWISAFYLRNTALHRQLEILNICTYF